MREELSVVAEGRFLRFVRRGRWEWVDRVNIRDVAVLVAITADDKIVLVEQYRIPVGARVVELPAGLVGDEEHHAGETLIEAANRELEEETGYRAASLSLLVRAPSSAGMTSEMISFVLAEDLTQVGGGGGVGDEEITVHLVPVRRAVKWLRDRERSGCLLDPKIFAGLFLAGRQAAL